MILLFQPGGGTYVDYGFYSKFESMESAVKTAFTEVLSGIGNLGDVTSAIAAIGATLYIGMRLLGHLARAEPVDVFPLFRPFVIGFLALNFGIVTGLLDAMIKPIETVTQNMVDVQTTRIRQIEELRAQKIQERLIQLDKRIDETSYWSAGDMGHLLAEKFRIYFDEGLNAFLKNILYALFLAARLVILTTRAFFIIILTIVGPLAFVAAIFTGFQDSHLMWMARYLQISLWFPLANILGTIVTYLQGKVLAVQYLELTNNVPDEASSGDLMYLVFMIIATIAYVFIPTAAGFIISSSGVGNAMQRITSISTSMAMASVPAITGTAQAGMTAGGMIAGGVGAAATMGLGAMVAGGRAVGQTAANYGSYYGAAVKQEVEKLRTITKS